MRGAKEEDAAVKLHGRTASCYDQSSNGFVMVAGDSCGTEHSYSKNLMAAKGNYNGSTTLGNPGTINNFCLYSTACFDGCSNSMKTFYNSNACTTNYDYSKSCVAGLGYCKN